MQWFISTTFHPADLISSLRADAVNFIIENDYSWKKMWKAQKTDQQWPVLTAMLSNNLWLPVLSTILWRWQTLLHTNCAYSPGTERKMVTITPTLTLFTRLCFKAWSCQPSIPSNRWKLHNDDAPFSPMIPVIFSSAFFHPSPSWFWMILVETNLLSVTQFPRL